MITKTLTVTNKLGLHARAASKLVSLSSRFGSSIEITRGKKTVNAKGILGVMLLAASKGSKITLNIEGKDEQEAMAAIEALFTDNFGEAE